VAERVRNVHLSSFFTARQEAEAALVEELAGMLETMEFAFGGDDDDDDEAEDESDNWHDPYGYRYGGGSWADDDCGA
jgi:hypothetical protein